MQTFGGASIACNRIADSLKSAGNLVFSIAADGTKSDTHYPLFLGKKFQILSRLFDTTFTRQLIDHFRVKELQRQLSILLNRIKPDLINVHNLHSANWPISLVKTCLKNAPVVWTLHDCWSFLGSYYPSHTPAPSQKLKKEINYFWESIKKNPTTNRLSAVTPSMWMKQQADKSFWGDYHVESIPNPIPDSYFLSKDRLACKRVLNLCENKTTVLCIAGNLTEERKGGQFIKDIIESGSSSDIQFLLLGESFSHLNTSDNVKILGFIRDEITIQMAYNAADLVVHPAPIDNLPNTVAESLSCGTPVLAFDTGGLGEMVIPQKTGWLVDKTNSKEIIQTLKRVLNSCRTREMRDSTKLIAKELFNEKKIGKKYSNHIVKLINIH
jgi:glycosyltransferase involved in cell wall biosynthesis